MKKPGPIVRDETKYIALWVCLLSVLMEAVFLILRAWDYTVLLGNFLSGSFAVLNFLWMGITIESAILKEEKEAKLAIRSSQSIRMFATFLVAALGVWLPFFNPWSSLVPLFFPRIAIGIRPFIKKDK